MGIKQAVKKRAAGPGYNRRANGDGALFQRKDGLWVCRVATGMYGKDGQPRFKEFAGKTQERAKAKATEYMRLRDSGQLVDYSTQTLAEYAAGFLDRYCAGKAPSTQRNYRLDLGHIVTHLGGMRLQHIKPKHIQAALERMKQEGYRRKPGGVVLHWSTRTFRHVLMTLRAMFQEAVRLQVVPTNPALAVRAPVVEKPADVEEQGRALEPDELQALNRELETHPMGVYFRLLLTTGLRKGEALALTWGDIELDRPAHIRVHRTWHDKHEGFSNPKTKGSRRKVPIPESMAQVLRVLKAATMAKLQTDISGLHLFGNPATNLPWNPTSVWHALNRMCTRQGLSRRVRVHDLRHTYGSHLLAQGVDIAVVSRYLGHANINITLGIYRSVLSFEMGEVPNVLELALERATKSLPVALPN